MKTKTKNDNAPKDEFAYQRQKLAERIKASAGKSKGMHPKEGDVIWEIQNPITELGPVYLKVTQGLGHVLGMNNCRTTTTTLLPDYISIRRNRSRVTITVGLATKFVFTGVCDVWLVPSKKSSPRVFWIEQNSGAQVRFEATTAHG